MADERLLTDNGNQLIPASQRADGSWRKERKVKAGYVPPDEVPLYESKGKQFVKDKPTYPVGLSVEQIAQHVAANDPTAPKKRIRKKDRQLSPGKIRVPEGTDLNASKSTAKKKGRGFGSRTASELRSLSIDNNSAKSSDRVLETRTAEVTPLEALEKKRRNMGKKLRDIEMLEERIKIGDLRQPEKNQLEKITKKPQLEDEIDEVEQQIEQLRLNS